VGVNAQPVLPSWAHPPCGVLLVARGHKGRASWGLLGPHPAGPTRWRVYGQPAAGAATPEAGHPVQALQFSMARPETREKCAALLVISVAPMASAWAAIMVSNAPMR
jgi:hypothetical protein